MSLKFESENIPTCGTHVAAIRNRSTGVLIDECQRVVIAAIIVPAAHFHALPRRREGKAIVDPRPESVGGAKIGLIVDIPSAQIPRTGLAEGQVDFKLPDAQVQRIRRQFQKPSDIDEFQVPITKGTVRIRPAYTDVVVYPESDAVAEVSCGKNTEKPGLEISAGI